MKWTKDHGSTTRQAYPYVEKKGTCQTDTGDYHIHGVEKIEGTVEGLKSALQERVVSVSIDANIFHDYESGVILTSECPYKALNHDIAAVGYSDAGNYFIIRNSWGVDFGEQGYALFEQGNGCGLLTDMVVPY
jgi:C1A family cysteine protease